MKSGADIALAMMVAASNVRDGEGSNIVGIFYYDKAIEIIKELLNVEGVKPMCLQIESPESYVYNHAYLIELSQEEDTGDYQLWVEPGARVSYPETGGMDITYLSYYPTMIFCEDGTGEYLNESENDSAIVFRL